MKTSLSFDLALDGSDYHVFRVLWCYAIKNAKHVRKSVYYCQASSCICYYVEFSSVTQMSVFAFLMRIH